MDTIRQGLFDKVVAQLKTIQTANTYTIYGQTGYYKSNLGLRVFPWRSTQFDDAEDDGLVVRDLDEPLIEAKGPNSLRHEHQMHMQVEIVGRGGKDIDKKVRNEYMADVEIAIGVGAFTVWNEIGNTRPRKNITIVEQESQKVAGMIFEFYIDYPTYAFYPYDVS